MECARRSLCLCASVARSVFAVFVRVA